MHVRIPFLRRISALCAAFGAILLLSAGCSTQAVQIRVIRPPKASFGDRTNIAIDTFVGDGGTEMRSDLMAALVNARNPAREDQGFAVVDNERLESILRIIERERSDVWNAETVTRLGELIGVAVLIHGRVTKYGVQETVQDQILGTNEGEPIFMRTRTAVAEIVCSITAADTSTGRVLDSANLTARAEDSATNLNGDPAPIDHSDLLRQVREKIVNQYITRVLPYEEWVAVRLYIDSDFPQLEVGNRLLQTGAWDEAISQYREALDRMTGELGKARWKALYNLGIALTYAGKFADARDALREAHAVSASSEALEALSIVDQREREYKALYPTSESNDAV